VRERVPLERVEQARERDRRRAILTTENSSSIITKGEREIDTNINKQERAREKEKKIYPWSEKDKQERDISFFERGGQAREG
jgi:hypothetical protein